MTGRVIDGNVTRSVYVNPALPSPLKIRGLEAADSCGTYRERSKVLPLK